MDADELAGWLRLGTTPGLGRAQARRLLGAFGSPQGIASASSSRLRAYLDESTLHAWREGEASAEAVLRRTLDWLAQAGEGAHARAVVTLGDTRYPEAWLESPDPPLFVHVQGHVDSLRQTAVAIVGSRHPTPQGREDAQAFARAFSEAGLTVVSGLALGIDSAAHAGALQGGGRTIAIVGTGLDRVYPPAHHRLAHRIAAQGALVSEFPLGTPPLAKNFPQRNRLIAGLGLGTLVVEAAVRSGSLITAREAAEAGREVFALPGSIHSPQSRGCHWLIKQGAKLVETAQDVLDELRLTSLPAHPIHQAAPAAATPPADPVLDALGFDIQTIDVLQDRTGWTTERLQARLLELELEGAISRLPGGRFQRLAHA